MPSEKDPKSFLIDAKAVRTLARILNETNLSEIEYELESGRIRVARARAVVSEITSASHPVVQAGPSPSSAPVSSLIKPEPTSFVDWMQHPGVLKAPLVGTVYFSAQPGSDPFVREGDTVQEGQTLLILEAMKVMNPIRSPKSGKITKIFVQNAQAIEFGEALLVIE